MPVLDALLARLPAPEDVAPVELAVEVHQSLVEPLEYAPDLLELQGSPFTRQIDLEALLRASKRQKGLR